MIIVDAHEDIAYMSLETGRDYALSALEHRQREAAAGYPHGRATLGLPEALAGGVAIAFATLFTEPKRKTALSATPLSAMPYTTPQEAYAVAMRQMDLYQRLFDTTPRLRPVRTLSDLDTVLATWDGDAPAEPAQGLVLLMENADPILEPEQFDEWYERGVRVVGPAWAGTRYCGGTGDPGPLTTLGRELLEVMAGLNALLDLSHMAEQSFFEALERYDGQVIASHSNARRMVNGNDARERHLSDTQIRLLAERDGVMGVNAFNAFLQAGWRKGDPRLPMARLLEAIDIVCQLTGSAQHVGIGTDFDGGFGAEAIPDGFDTEQDLNRLPDLLRPRGYSEDDITAIMGGNFLRKLRQTLPA